MLQKIGGEMTKKRGCGKLFLLYLQCYFISIATILGTGILGLPVTLHKAGFYPFLLTFTVGYIMQVFVICQMVEVLQYCKAILAGHASIAFTPLNTDDSQEVLLSKRKNRRDKEHVLFDIQREPANAENPTISDGEEDSEDDHQFGDHDPVPVKSIITEPNLHILGKLFLHKYVQPFFLLILFVHFIAIAISYSLAGSEAYGQVLGVKYATAIPFFTWILSIIIIMMRQYIRPVIALMTLAKGSLLFATVIVTISAGATVNRPISDDWKSIDKPFLMGTVALGGVPMVMPMLFDKFEAVRDQMRGFRNSLVGGITTCFILNIMWCWAVLKVVPQSYDSCMIVKTIVESGYNSTFTTTTPTTETTGADITEHSCDPDVTLQAAKDVGEISTVPLTQIIETDHVELKWIAFVIQIFIVISITVSFLTLGSAMQHTVCGWVDDTLSRYKNCRLTGTCCSFLLRNWFWHYFFGLLCFSTIFTVAMMDPKGFVSILEKLASFGLNTMSGIFMFLLVRAARSRQYRHVRIPLSTNSCFRNIHYLTLTFFSLAVLYDIIVTIIGR